MLGNKGKQAHGECVRARHVAADKVHPPVAQGENEAGIAAGPVQLGNQQRRAHAPGLGDGGQQLRPRVLLAALDFHELGPELGRVRHVGAHRGLLGFQAQTQTALLLGGDSILRGVAAHRRHQIRTKGKKVFAGYCVLHIANVGFLADKYEKAGAGTTSGADRFTGFNPFGNTKLTDKNWRILEALRPVAPQLERPLAQVALAWASPQPGITPLQHHNHPEEKSLRTYWLRICPQSAIDAKHRGSCTYQGQLARF